MDRLKLYILSQSEIDLLNDLVIMPSGNNLSIKSASLAVSFYF